MNLKIQAPLPLQSLCSLLTDWLFFSATPSRDSHEQIEEQKRQIEEQNEQNEKLEMKNKELEINKNEVIEWDINEDDLPRERVSASGEAQIPSWEQREEIEGQENQIEAQKKEIKKLEKEIKKLEKEIKKLEKEKNDALEWNNEQLNDKTRMDKTLDEAIKLHWELVNQNKELGQELEDQRRQNEKMNEKIKGQGKKIGGLEMKLRESTQRESEAQEQIRQQAEFLSQSRKELEGRSVRRVCGPPWNDTPADVFPTEQPQSSATQHSESAQQRETHIEPRATSASDLPSPRDPVASVQLQLKAPYQHACSQTSASLIPNVGWLGSMGVVASVLAWWYFCRWGEQEQPEKTQSGPADTSTGTNDMGTQFPEEEDHDSEVPSASEHSSVTTVGRGSTRIRRRHEGMAMVRSPTGRSPAHIRSIRKRRDKYQSRFVKAYGWVYKVFRMSTRA